MDAIFSLDDISSNTSQVLEDCLDIFQSPAHQAYDHRNLTSFGPAGQNHQHHPDIQFFQKVKQRNHFTYHKSKVQQQKSIEKIQSKSTIFDPYDLGLLLGRLRSFNCLNWQVPNGSELHELKCARNGWKCASFGRTIKKNHLICTNCHQQLILRFTSNHITSETSPFDIDFLSGEQQSDDGELNSKLVEKYLNQIVTSGHSLDCSWRNFEVPLDGVYYPRHYLVTTNNFLITQYLKNLKSLVDNSLLLQEYYDSISPISIPSPEFVGISNQWLIARYFNQDKENVNTLLQHIPTWFYEIAARGWNINIQKYANDVILVMSCGLCNSRVFLNTITSQQHVNLNSLQALTPVKYPLQPNQDELTAFDQPQALVFDPVKDHKSFCPHIHDNNLHEYFNCLILGSVSNIGNNGEYVDNNDMMIIDKTTTKRRKSFTMNDGLERLNKLRKLYLIED
ncbi:hypothetical protein JA1_003549 [Spathaspora sp. JA1]|nr:hypothetical protein JA1_003549 [Spathaspora sp. JA1]